MTENQANSDIANPSPQREEPPQNTQDPLPWLIRALVEKQQRVSERFPASEARKETRRKN